MNDNGVLLCVVLSHLHVLKPTPPHPHSTYKLKPPPHLLHLLHSIFITFMGSQTKNCFHSESDETPSLADDRKRRPTKKSGPAPPCCQADGCPAILADAKRYHRRHKVCEPHAKAVSVLVGGFRQRFCQQCSRFHELSEFDEAKRSCRWRLAGHNERRRKGSSSEPQATDEKISR